MLVLVSVASVLLLVHAGFSTIHFKGIAPAESLPPLDVVVEVSIAFVLAVLASVASMPDLKKVRLADIVLTPRQIDVAFNCPDFMVFNHRGRAIAQRRRALKP